MSDDRRDDELVSYLRQHAARAAPGSSLLEERIVAATKRPLEDALPGARKGRLPIWVLAFGTAAAAATAYLSIGRGHLLHAPQAHEGPRSILASDSPGDADDLEEFVESSWDETFMSEEGLETQYAMLP